MTCWHAGQPGLRSNTATAVIVERLRHLYAAPDPDRPC